MRVIASQRKCSVAAGMWIAGFASLCFVLSASDAWAKPRPATLSVVTTSLPNGTIGTSYSATLAATGGSTPYSWSLTSGSLPGGLTLSRSGTISGTPTATANAVSLTFKVMDASHPTQSKSVTLSLTIAAVPLRVTTSSLPNGQVGTAYSGNLAASGGTLPLHWALTSGTLPAGLSLSSAGAITGTPTTAQTVTGLIFTATDSGVPVQKALSSSLGITITGLAPTVSVSPRRAALTVTQTLSLTATTNDGSSVNWSATGSNCSGTACGTFSAQNTGSGSAVSYTSPAVAGQYTITATDAINSAVQSSITVGVTDLTGVATYHNNSSRNGVNSQEYALSPGNVTANTFGKIFSCSVDGAVYAQPLWVPNLMIGGSQHNVIFVATQHDSLYAFDADTAPCTTLWHVSLIDTAHGGASGETSVSFTMLGTSSGDIQPEVGVTGTPVIDPAGKILYVVSKSIDKTGTNFYQRLHAIDLFTGNEKLVSGPNQISGTFPAINSTVTFSAQQENQRPGLALVNGVVYVAWASHEDASPWYGWMMGFDAATLAKLYTFNVAPNAGAGGIWMGGGAPSADASGNLYVITGNGNFDATSQTAPNNDYGDSFLQLSKALAVLQYFTPANQDADNTNDADFGSGGTSVVVDLPANGSLPTHLVIGGGKDGNLCLLSRDSLGGYDASNSGAVQVLNFGNGIYGTPAYFNWSFYLAGESGKLQQFTLNRSTYKIDSSPASTSAISYGFPGTTPSVTTMPDNSNAIVWALDNGQYCTQQAPGCGPAVIHAYDATNLGTELWNSSQGTGNSAGLAVKFTVPTVANGKVYVGTRGNNSVGTDTTATIPGELDVYGLLPN